MYVTIISQFRYFPIQVDFLSFNQLSNYLKTINILSLLQFEFCKMLFTGHAIVDIIKHIKSIVNGGNFACELFLDFQKACNTVSMNNLLETMSNYSICGPLIQWLKSYLNCLWCRRNRNYMPIIVTKQVRNFYSALLGRLYPSIGLKASIGCLNAMKTKKSPPHSLLGL